MTIGYSIETLIAYMHRWPPFHDSSVESLRLDIQIAIYFQFKNGLKTNG